MVKKIVDFTIEVKDLLSKKPYLIDNSLRFEGSLRDIFSGQYLEEINLLMKIRNWDIVSQLRDVEDQDHKNPKMIENRIDMICENSHLDHNGYEGIYSWSFLLGLITREKYLDKMKKMDERSFYNLLKDIMDKKKMFILTVTTGIFVISVLFFLLIWDSGSAINYYENKDLGIFQVAYPRDWSYSNISQKNTFGHDIVNFYPIDNKKVNLTIGIKEPFDENGNITKYFERSLTIADYNYTVVDIDKLDEDITEFEFLYGNGNNLTGKERIFGKVINNTLYYLDYWTSDINDFNNYIDVVDKFTSYLGNIDVVAKNHFSILFHNESSLEYGIPSVTFPTYWTKKTNLSSDNYFFGKDIMEFSSHPLENSITIGLRQSPLNADSNHKDITEYLESLVKEYIDGNYTLTETPSSIFKNASSITFTHNNGTFKTTVLGILKGDLLYYMDYSADVLTYDNDLADAERIFQSLMIDPTHLLINRLYSNYSFPEQGVENVAVPSYMYLEQENETSNDDGFFGHEIATFSYANASVLIGFKEINKNINISKYFQGLEEDNPNFNLISENEGEVLSGRNAKSYFYTYNLDSGKVYQGKVVATLFGNKLYFIDMYSFKEFFQYHTGEFRQIQMNYKIHDSYDDYNDFIKFIDIPLTWEKANTTNTNPFRTEISRYLNPVDKSNITISIDNYPLNNSTMINDIAPIIQEAVIEWKDATPISVDNSPIDYNRKLFSEKTYEYQYRYEYNNILVDTREIGSIFDDKLYVIEYISPTDTFRNNLADFEKITRSLKPDKASHHLSNSSITFIDFLNNYSNPDFGISFNINSSKWVRYNDTNDFFGKDVFHFQTTKSENRNGIIIGLRQSPLNADSNHKDITEYLESLVKNIDGNYTLTETPSSIFKNASSITFTHNNDTSKNTVLGILKGDLLYYMEYYADVLTYDNDLADAERIFQSLMIDPTHLLINRLYSNYSFPEQGVENVAVPSYWEQNNDTFPYVNFFGEDFAEFFSTNVGNGIIIGLRQSPLNADSNHKDITEYLESLVKEYIDGNYTLTETPSSIFKNASSITFTHNNDTSKNTVLGILKGDLLYYMEYYADVLTYDNDLADAERIFNSIKVNPLETSMETSIVAGHSERNLLHNTIL